MMKQYEADKILDYVAMMYGVVHPKLLDLINSFVEKDEEQIYCSNCGRLLLGKDKICIKCDYK